MLNMSLNSDFSCNILKNHTIKQLSEFIARNQTEANNNNIPADFENHLKLTPTQQEIIDFVGNFLNQSTSNQRSKPLRIIITGIAGEYVLIIILTWF